MSEWFTDNPPSAYMLRHSLIWFLEALRDLKLTTARIGVVQAEKFVRRHKSRYDTSPIIHNAYNDSLI